MGFLEAAKFLKLGESRSGDSLDEERSSTRATRARGAKLSAVPVRVSICNWNA